MIGNHVVKFMLRNSFCICSTISIFNIPTDGIVMEEVTNRGYHIQFEKTGLNFDQSVLALQKLACFHAASVIVMSTVRMIAYQINQRF